MAARIWLLALTAFWVTMNVLLWRAEYGGRAGLGSAVPPRVVWEKILTAPDSSSLTVFRQGKKIGFCHWITSVGEDLNKLSAAEAPPEGMVPRIVNYRLELDGNVLWDNPGDRVRFDSHLTLGRNEQWQEFDIRLNLRPSTLDLRSVAAQKTLKFSWQDDSGKTERVIKFSELEHPEALLQEFGGPAAAALFGSLGASLGGETKALKAPALEWQARDESLRLGHSTTRVYRLQSRILDRFSVVIFVSRVGEILRAELPGDIVLTNDQLGGN
ncbi:MAG TPA: hypothetical protein VKY92_28230 [Verrucomicrobiae bacterium]|nr:hypothetical protein [Verrucomicrobiae bacterium]